MAVVHILLFACIAMATAMTIRPTIPECPENCKCRQDGIACNKLTSLPAKWPTSITRITISKSALDEIRPGAFANLKALSRIMITNSNITNIRQCAFSQLSNVLISVDHCRIDTVDSYAFSYLYNTRVKFVRSVIQVLSPYAFTRSQKAKTWDFINVNITSVETRAFHNLSKIRALNFKGSNFHELKSVSMSKLNGVQMVELTRSKVDFLYCKTFGEVVSTAGYFAFHGNALYCDCRLDWLFNSSILTSQRRAENRCHGPQSLVDRGYGESLGNLTEKDLVCDGDDVRDTGCHTFDIPEDPATQCNFAQEIASTTPLASIPTTVSKTSKTTPEPTSETSTPIISSPTRMLSTDATAKMSSSTRVTTQVSKTTTDLTTTPSPSTKGSTISITTLRKTSTDTPSTATQRTMTTHEPTSEPTTPETTSAPRTSSIRTPPHTTEILAMMRTKTPSQTDERPTTEQTAEYSTTSTIPNARPHTSKTTPEPTSKTSTPIISSPTRMLSTDATAKMSSSTRVTTQVSKTTTDLTTTSSPSTKGSTMSMTALRKTSTDTPRTATQRTMKTHEPTSEPTTPETTSAPRTSSITIPPSTPEIMATRRARTPNEPDERPTTEQTEQHSPSSTIPNPSLDEDNGIDEEVNVNATYDGSDDQNHSTDDIDASERNLTGPVPVVIDTRINVSSSRKEVKTAQSVGGTPHSSRIALSLFVLCVTSLLLMAL